MRILIWADLHGHNFREFSTIEDGVNTRLRDCTDVVGKILLSAREEKVDEVWFVGDLYHLKNNLDNQVIQHIMYEMKNLADNLTVYIVPGNHDYRAWSSDPVLLEVLHEMPGKFVLVEQGFIKRTGLYAVGHGVYVEPYTRKVKELSQRIASVETNPEKDIFFGHQDILGARYGGFVVEQGLDADMLSKKFRWSFVGHNHTPSKIRDNVISVGAPLQHNFGDAGGDRGWWILDTKKGEVEFVKNNFSPQFVDYTYHSEIGDIFSGDRAKDFYRIKVVGQVELSEGLKEIRWKRISYDIKSQAKKRAEISFSDKKEDIIQKYVKLRGGDLDHKRLIEMGRKYL